MLNGLFYYVGNIVLDISGISTKVSYDNTWRSHFCSFVLTDRKCYYMNVQKVENKNVRSKDMCQLSAEAMDVNTALSIQHHSF